MPKLIDLCIAYKQPIILVIMGLIAGGAGIGGKAIYDNHQTKKAAEASIKAEYEANLAAKVMDLEGRVGLMEKAPPTASTAQLRAVSAKVDNVSGKVDKLASDLDNTNDSVTLNNIHIIENRKRLSDDEARIAGIPKDILKEVDREFGYLHSQHR